MKFTVTILLIIALCLPAMLIASGDDSGTFRGKWWNYYERALESSEKGDLSAAVNDLTTAIDRRDKDQRMARTYGMHFVDYFPHRELGIVYFNQGDTAKAAQELETSLKHEESSKAAFYLNKVKQQELQKQKAAIAGPEIVVVSPASGAVVKTSSVVIKGKASGKGQVAKITINGSPFRFDRARESMEFTQEVPVEDGHNEITVAAGDLLGNSSQKTIEVTVDRDGPSVQIFDVKQEVENGRKYLRITGEVSDATWISKLKINGKAVDVSGEKAWPLNERLEIGTKAVLKIEAVDPFENETIAELDAEKDLLALLKPMKPFLIASIADKIIGFDNQPPELTLKTSGDIPPVFSERFYVEGAASDNLNVGRIVINNKEVFIKKGKRIYFSKIVNLREGKNDITVDVYDTSDNKTTRTITVSRKIPAVMQNAARMSITVLPFDEGKGSDRAKLAYEQLIGAFVDQKRFSIIERAKLEQILMEQKLTKEKLTDPEHSIRVGKLMSADAVLVAVVREDAKSIEIVARVISTETSEVLDVKDAFAEDKSSSSVKELMTDLAAKFATGFPVIEGMVVKAGGRDIVMDVGDASNIKKNMTVILFRKGVEIKHPVTGKSLGFDTIKLAEGRVEDVQAAFSKVRLLDKPAAKEVRVKDLIITK
jgi:hypothetical protein